MGKINRYLWLFLFPVFFTYGPNAVGYSTIIITDMRDENAIQPGQKIACNVSTEYGHRLVEGRLLVRRPLIISVDTPLLRNVPLPFPEDNVEFCLISGAESTRAEKPSVFIGPF